jgi:hypothetical protein
MLWPRGMALLKSLAPGYGAPQERLISARPKLLSLAPAFRANFTGGANPTAEPVKGVLPGTTYRRDGLTGTPASTTPAVDGGDRLLAAVCVCLCVWGDAGQRTMVEARAVAGG